MGGFISRKRQYHHIRPGGLEERIECVIYHTLKIPPWQASKCGITYNCFLEGYFDNNKGFNAQGPRHRDALVALLEFVANKQGPLYGGEVLSRQQ